MSGQKVILVTGASAGIGEACARLLHEQGNIVYGASRNPGPAAWKTLALDVTSDEAVARGVAQILAEQGRVDVVVNNAGLVFAGSVEDTSMEEAKAQFETNFFGVMRVSKAVLPSMRLRKTGLFVNVSSLAGLLGLPFQGLYSASKFALEGLTESMRPEVAGFGVEVVLLEPGDIATSVVANRIRVAASGAGSVYRDNFEKVVALFEKEETHGAAPAVVARRVARLIETSKPAVRYTTGPMAQRFLTALKPFFPSRLFERCLTIYYGIKG